MMKQIEIPNNSYAYLNFIDEDDRLELKDWIIDLFNRGKLRENGSGRFFTCVSWLDEEPIELFEDVKMKIMSLEKLQLHQQDEYLDDFLSVNIPGAHIHEHTDTNRDNHIHTRYNLIVNRAEGGGYPIYNDSLVDYENGMLWRCEAGRYMHSSTPVMGSEYRINISYGFQVPV